MGTTTGFAARLIIFETGTTSIVTARFAVAVYFFFRFVYFFLFQNHFLFPLLFFLIGVWAGLGRLRS